MLAGPPPHTPPGTIRRQGHVNQTLRSLRGCTVRLETLLFHRLARTCRANFLRPALTHWRMARVGDNPSSN